MVSRRARAAVSSDICFIEVIGKRVFFLEELTTLIFVLAGNILWLVSGQGLC